MRKLQSNVGEYLLCKLNISENLAFYLYRKGNLRPRGNGDGGRLWYTSSVQNFPNKKEYFHWF